MTDTLDYSRPDGTFVATINGLPYHVTPETPFWEWAKQLVDAHGPPPLEPGSAPADNPPLIIYAELKKLQLISAGLPYDGKHIALDMQSRADLSGMATTAVAVLAGKLGWPDSYALGWITKENVRIPLPTPEDGLQLAALVGDYYAVVVQACRTAKDEVLAGNITTTAGVDAVFASALE